MVKLLYCDPLRNKNNDGKHYHPCPQCGHSVPVEERQCKNCGFKGCASC